jgi:hypothetical protein
MINIGMSRCGVAKSMASVLLVIGMQAVSAAPANNCQLLLGDSQIDYGTVTRSALNPLTKYPRYLSFGKRVVTATAVCATPTRMSLFFRGSASPNNLFRFGEHNGFVVHAMQAQLDNRPVQLAPLAAPGQPAGAGGASVTLMPGQGVTVAASDGGVGRQLSLQLEVEAYLSDSAAHVTAAQTFEGNTSIELHAE